ncbi:DNA-binding protein [Chromobacterium amazonense]|uniref:DNA-binding protein n=1 Tax=Chromobacterium amazonense TaxID=1382803 RepID=A0A2S9WZ47_9NEIS|nr:DNA-binding protein [Chromobacterium amazonense]PRP68741.1 DNA-binding protein [Chromobacterium amazonense]
METLGTSSIERGLRSALTNPRTASKVADSLNWDNSQVSRFLSGQMGLTIDKIDTAVQALGYVCVQPKYLDAMATLCQVGANCACARKGLGECGSGGD